MFDRDLLLKRLRTIEETHTSGVSFRAGLLAKWLEPTAEIPDRLTYRMIRTIIYEMFLVISGDLRSETSNNFIDFLKRYEKDSRLKTILSDGEDMFCLALADCISTRVGKEVRRYYRILAFRYQSRGIQLVS